VNLNGNGKAKRASRHNKATFSDKRSALRHVHDERVAAPSYSRDYQSTNGIEESQG
jgi:hypothetical protein